MRRHWLRFVLFGVVAVVVSGFVVMTLWNALVPPIIGWHSINYWQALGLLVLSRILFGGFRGGPGGRMHWRRRMMERWEHMTPEEREKFHDGMRACGKPERSTTSSGGGVAGSGAVLRSSISV